MRCRFAVTKWLGFALVALVLASRGQTKQEDPIRAVRAVLARISVQLTRYSGLVEAARASNKSGVADANGYLTAAVRLAEDPVKCCVYGSKRFNDPDLTKDVRQQLEEKHARQPVGHHRREHHLVGVGQNRHRHRFGCHGRLL